MNEGRAQQQKCLGVRSRNASSWVSNSGEFWSQPMGSCQQIDGLFYMSYTDKIWCSGYILLIQQLLHTVYSQSRPPMVIVGLARKPYTTKWCREVVIKEDFCVWASLTVDWPTTRSRGSCSQCSALPDEKASGVATQLKWAWALTLGSPGKELRHQKFHFSFKNNYLIPLSFEIQTK